MWSELTEIFSRIGEDPKTKTCKVNSSYPYLAIAS